jgi:DNA-binding NtrC family response regulator
MYDAPALPDDEELFGDSCPELRRLAAQVRAVAALPTTVLLAGETGTGKTRLGRALHRLSPRQHRPFLVVNCGSLSASLIESELFGHVKGSYTGADRDRTGKLAEADDGTLLLDDVDALPPSVQAKLLRVVEDHLFEPVGCNQSLPLRARLIAASNRELREEVAAGRFRADLYYRLDVVSFRLPPLRRRPGAVRRLAERFAAELGGRLGRPGLTVSEAALRALEAHDWPGNVRELRNVIERAAALCEGPQVTTAELPESVGRPMAAAEVEEAGPVPLSRARMEVERERIAEALRRHGNNRLRAAAALGVSRMTLYKKLHKYGLIEWR